ncbi:adhesion G protein-coupled receptor E2 [Biomphalaria glabrata]|nr:adhesion G protein-coupled receptor E2-like [Biomphalaria glabrata]
MKKAQYKNLILYVKLSSVTGVFWIVTIVAEAVDSDVLRLISTVLNGLQGVLIFVSYMCNKRIYGLYFKRGELRQSSTVKKNRSSRM